MKPLRLVTQALALFVGINVAFAYLNLPWDEWSLCGSVVSARPRPPIEGTWTANGFSVAANEQIMALVGAHQLAAVRPDPNSFRVIVLRDSQKYGA